MEDLLFKESDGEGLRRAAQNSFVEASCEILDVGLNIKRTKSRQILSNTTNPKLLPFVLGLGPKNKRARLLPTEKCATI